MKGLNGNKTYAVAALTALYGVIGSLLQLHELDYTVELLLAAGGMVGLRSSLKKLED